MDAEELTGSLKKLVMWYKVKELKSKGLNKTQIARCLGINRNTVRKYQSMSESEFMNSQSYRRNYNHKLDPYEDFVHKSLDSHPYLSSSQIRDWLREQYEDFPDVGQKTVYTYVQYIRRKYHISKRVGHGNRQYQTQPMENTLKLILANDGCMIRSIIRSKSTSMPLSYAGADTSIFTSAGVLLQQP